MREGSVRPRVTARRRCSGVAQWQGAGLWHQLSRFESSHLNCSIVSSNSGDAPADGSDPTLRTSEAWFNSTSGYQASQWQRSSRRRRKVCRLFRIQDIGLVRFQPPRPCGDCKAAGSPTKSHGRERYPDPVPTDRTTAVQPLDKRRMLVRIQLGGLSCHVTRSVSRADCRSAERGSTPLRGAPRFARARAHRAVGRLLNGPNGVRDPTRAPDPAR